MGYGRCALTCSTLTHTHTHAYTCTHAHDLSQWFTEEREKGQIKNFTSNIFFLSKGNKSYRQEALSAMIHILQISKAHGHDFLVLTVSLRQIINSLSILQHPLLVLSNANMLPKQPGF